MGEEALFVSEDPSAKSDDPVVSEVPIILDNNAGDSTVLLQYPTRKSQQSYHVSKVRVKPGAQTIETDIDLNVPPEYIDSGNGGSTLQGLTQTYSGVLKANDGRFALGYMHNGAFHLTLVPRTGQLRPKFASQSSTLLQPSMLQASTTQNRAQDQAQPSLRSVQMSVKSTNAELPKHSSVLEFWRQANKEEGEDYEPRPISDEERNSLLAAEEGAEQVDIELDSASQLTFL